MVRVGRQGVLAQDKGMPQLSRNSPSSRDKLCRNSLRQCRRVARQRWPLFVALISVTGAAVGLRFGVGLNVSRRSLPSLKRVPFGSKSRRAVHHPRALRGLLRASAGRVAKRGQRVSGFVEQDKGLRRSTRNSAPARAESSATLKPSYSAVLVRRWPLLALLICGSIARVL